MRTNALAQGAHLRADRKATSSQLALHDDGHLWQGVSDTDRLARVLDGPRAHALAGPLLLRVLGGSTEGKHASVGHGEFSSGTSRMISHQKQPRGNATEMFGLIRLFLGMEQPRCFTCHTVVASGDIAVTGVPTVISTHLPVASLSESNPDGQPRAVLDTRQREARAWV